MTTRAWRRGGDAAGGPRRPRTPGGRAGAGRGRVDPAEALAAARRARAWRAALRALAQAERAHALSPTPRALTTRGRAPRHRRPRGQRGRRARAAPAPGHPENAPGWAALGATLRARGELDAAADAASRLIEEDEEDPHGWRVMALVVGPRRDAAGSGRPGALGAARPRRARCAPPASRCCAEAASPATTRSAPPTSRVGSRGSGGDDRTPRVRDRRDRGGAVGPRGPRGASPGGMPDAPPGRSQVEPIAVLAQPGAPGADTGAISSTAQKAGEWSGRTRWQTSWATWSATASGASSSRQENDRRPVEPQLPSGCEDRGSRRRRRSPPAAPPPRAPAPERAPRLLPYRSTIPSRSPAGASATARRRPPGARTSGGPRRAPTAPAPRRAAPRGRRRPAAAGRPEQRLLLGDPSLRRPQEPVHLCGASPPRNGQADAGSGHPQRHARACCRTTAQPKGRREEPWARRLSAPARLAR